MDSVSELLNAYDWRKTVEELTAFVRTCKELRAMVILLAAEDDKKYREARIFGRYSGQSEESGTDLLTQKPTRIFGS